MKKVTLLLTAIICIVYFIKAPFSNAQYGSYGSYGSPSYVEQIIIDKFVGRPLETEETYNVTYVDNLDISDYNFSPGQYIFFKIIVKNTSGVKLSNVTIKDTWPLYLEIFQTVGTFDDQTRVLTINAGDLSPDETKTYKLKARVLYANELPQEKNQFCLTNFVSAKSGNAYDEDTASFCINKKSVLTSSYTETKGGQQVKGVKTIPASGSENLILGIFAPLLGYFGFKLRKYN